MTTFTVETFEDENGDLVLPLPQEMVDDLGWKEGDTILWTQLDNGGFQLSLQQSK